MPQDKDLEQGDKCPNVGCQGSLDFPPVEGCYCHLSAPCNVCIDNRLRCDECNWIDGDPITTTNAPEEGSSVAKKPKQ